jgi:uncharacterized protein (DUF1697 family)
MARYVALLRGINVSGHNPVAMKDLRALFSALPAEEVTTYLQSGNVVFHAAGDAEGQRSAIEERIASELHLDVVVLVLTAEELDRVIADNPFPVDADDSPMPYVTFLASPPEAERVAALVPPPGPDVFSIGRREVYLSCPNGYGRTKLNNAFFEKKLAVAATTRNWRTVTALAEMARV